MNNPNFFFNELKKELMNQISLPPFLILINNWSYFIEELKILTR